MFTKYLSFRAGGKFVYRGGETPPGAGEKPKAVKETPTPEEALKEPTRPKPVGYKKVSLEEFLQYEKNLPKDQKIDEIVAKIPDYEENVDNLLSQFLCRIREHFDIRHNTRLAVDYGKDALNRYNDKLVVGLLEKRLYTFKDFKDLADKNSKEIHNIFMQSPPSPDKIKEAVKMEDGSYMRITENEASERMRSGEIIYYSTDNKTGKIDFLQKTNPPHSLEQDNDKINNILWEEYKNNKEFICSDRKEICEGNKYGGSPDGSADLVVAELMFLRGEITIQDLMEYSDILAERPYKYSAEMERIELWEREMLEDEYVPEDMVRPAVTHQLADAERSILVPPDEYFAKKARSTTPEK